MSDNPILLYDGACPVCARSVRFILRHDRRRVVRFAVRRGAVERALAAEWPSSPGRDAASELAAIESLVWYEPPRSDRPARFLVHSDALLAVAATLGGGWALLGRLGRIVPRPLRDAAYRIFARNRHRFAGGAATCLVPTAEERSRFLDGGIAGESPADSTPEPVRNSSPAWKSHPTQSGLSKPSAAADPHG